MIYASTAVQILTSNYELITSYLSSLCWNYAVAINYIEN